MRYEIKFNNYRQSVIFVIHDIPLRQFRRINKCYAYYIAAEVRYKTKGCFGHIRLGEVTHELVAHEMVHFQADYLNSRGGLSEERMALIVGDITGKFWKEYIGKGTACTPSWR